MDAVEGAAAVKQAKRELHSALADIRAEQGERSRAREEEAADTQKSAWPGEGIGALLDIKV